MNLNAFDPILDRFFSHDAFDRALARDEGKRLTPQDNGDDIDYSKLSEDGQRDEIELQLRYYPIDKSVVFEAFGNHKDSERFIAVFLSGDHCELGKLADKMIREHMNTTVTERLKQER